MTLVADGVQDDSERLDKRRDATSLRQTVLHVGDCSTLDGDQVLGGSQQRQRVARFAEDHDAADGRRRLRLAAPTEPVDEPVDGREAGPHVGQVGARDVQSQNRATMTKPVAADARSQAVGVAAAARCRRRRLDAQVHQTEHRVAAQQTVVDGCRRISDAQELRQFHLH